MKGEQKCPSKNPVTACYFLPVHLMYCHARPLMRCLNTKVHISNLFWLSYPNHHVFECSEVYFSTKSCICHLCCSSFWYAERGSYAGCILCYSTSATLVICRLNKNAVSLRDISVNRIHLRSSGVFWLFIGRVGKWCFEEPHLKRDSHWESCCTRAVAWTWLSWGLLERLGKMELAPCTWGFSQFSECFWLQYESTRGAGMKL